MGENFAYLCNLNEIICQSGIFNAHLSLKFYLNVK